MSSERLGCVALNSMPFLSPDLPLETMSTSDMFDTSWDCSSGVDNEISDANIAPSLIPPEVIDDNFFVWDTEHILQTNLFETELETCFEDDMAVLSPVSSLHAKEDINFLHNEDSNMLSASSSALTFASCALPQSPYCFSENLEDVQISTSPSLHMLSSLANCSLVSTSLSCILPDNLFSEELQNSEAHSSRHLLQESISKLNSKAEIKGCCEERASHPGKQKKVLRSPLATSSQLSSNTNVLFHSMADPPHKNRLPSTYQQYKASTKENGISPRKKKASNILDSNIKWSELDSSEQWAVGKGIGVMLSQSLGIREKLDLLNILSSTSPDISLTSGDIDLISSLDDEKLERIRLYLRGLDNVDDNSTSRLPINKYGKVLQKYNNKNYLRRNESLQCSSNEHKILGVGKVEGRPNMSEGISLKLTKTQHSRFPRHDPLIMTHLSTHTRSSKKNATQKFKQNKTRKKYTSQNLHLQYTRSKKEHRQLMKEKRSGLFEQEEVVLVSTTTYKESVQQHDQNKDEEEIDILG